MKPSNKRYIRDIIDNIFEESLRSVKKKLISEGEGDLFDDAESEEKDKEEKPSEEKEKVEPSKDKEVDASDDDTEKLKSGDVTADDVVEKLNTIRSGKSFKDEEIMTKMSEYVDSLEKPEKTALLTFLKALSQIVTGEVPADEAIKPSAKPVDVKMEKEPAVKKRTIKPTVINMSPSDEDKEKKTPAEDSKGPVPIVAKKK